MQEPLTISKEAPAQKSMDYELLREEGLKYIQNIAGKLWTDYNTHDPGITILDVLCYALTDLGYRTSYDIKDILAPDPEETGEALNRNFFTAAEMLPNAPITYNDYRKLMIDVEVYDPGPDSECLYAGVKNAWIEKALRPEIDIFVDEEESQFLYEPAKPADEPLSHKILHNVLLEFDRCEAFGDLNENKITRDYTIPVPAASGDYDAELEGVVIRVDVEFPRWDDEELTGGDETNLAEGITYIDLSFLNLGGNFSIKYELNATNEVILRGTKASVSGPENIDGLDIITQKLNRFIFEADDSMLVFYRRKIIKIQEIVAEVKATLHANRNLCEDFLQFNALRIEEILTCADIELELDANVEETQARMFHEIAKFLSPTVYFYTLEEMMNRCFDEYQYDITDIDTDSRIFTINKHIQPIPEQGTVITITHSNNNNGTFTVKDARINADDETQTDIFVQEAISSNILTEGEKLYLVNLEEDQCRPTEDIFEGPLLQHGFIDDAELALADRKKVIHVSDLIQIIMDVPGVIAVKNIQIANVPQDNEDGAIASKSVRWCLQLAFNQNYVPRLNTDDSRITFFKDQLPFRANPLQVDAIMQDLAQTERPQKQRNPVMDFEPPSGEYRDPGNYHSIQHEFPLIYGIGDEGIPSSSEGSLNVPTQAHARQLKGFLMHFDQLLANYLSQLAHVKDLFSMNPQRDEFGNFAIGRTYYTQPLADLVPNAKELYVDKTGHPKALNDIAESEELFGERRNRFLDHLMARFAEQFTDYALLSYRISGAKSQEELIEDKLAFLNCYPQLSRRRGTALDYRDPCRLWHPENVSGLEKRAALLTGIAEQPISSLHFSPRFKITGSAPDIEFKVENEVPKAVLKSSSSFETKDEAREALEKVITNGVQRHKYTTQTDDETDYYFQLWCDDEVIAESTKKDFTNAEDDGDTDQAIDEIIALLSEEFYTNAEANRHNLACSLLNYFDYDDIAVDMAPDLPTFTIDYDLYKDPFSFDEADPILSGSYTGQGMPKERAGVITINTTSSTFTVDGDIRENLAEDLVVVIDDSGGSDGVYTIASFGLNGDGNTEIMVNETIASDSAPFGRLLYNLVTEEEMLAQAEAAVHDVLWRVVAHGVRRSNYAFNPAMSPFDSPYTFRITGLRGDLLGESTAFDFNESVASEIANVSSSSITIIEPGKEPAKHTFSMSGATARGPEIDVQLDSPPLPAPTVDWQLQIMDSFPVKAIHADEQLFSLQGDLTDKLSTGHTITISDHASNEGNYTIFELEFDGTESHIKVLQAIPSAEVEDGEGGSAKLGYSKTFPVIKTAGDVITIKGGGDETAVSEMIEFLESTFFTHEGLHLIEHNLLRAKVNEPLFVDADDETLSEGLAENGTLLFTKQHTISSVDIAAKTVEVEGDITADISEGMSVVIQNLLLPDAGFTIASFSFTATNTEITLKEMLLTGADEWAAGGMLSYAFEDVISGIRASDRQIIIAGNAADTIKAGAVIEIASSSDAENDGRYTIEGAVDEAADTEITVQKTERPVKDRLLSINLDEECECTLQDPYTCVVHVVLPYWPGRFTNNDFRTFFEKTLRREAPAHVYLNICWVSCRHMAAFERAYKTWLLENSRSTTNKSTLSKALDELIESMENLRNVYPEGRLHDCEEDENLENAIILNNSVLGEI